MSNIRLHPKYGLNPTIPICAYCGKEKNEVALLGDSYKHEAPRSLILDNIPCDECKTQMSKGFTIIEIDKDDKYRLPKAWMVVNSRLEKSLIESLDISDEAKDKLKKNRRMLAEQGFINHIVQRIEQGDSNE